MVVNQNINFELRRNVSGLFDCCGISHCLHTVIEHVTLLDTISGLFSLKQLS